MSVECALVEKHYFGGRKVDIKRAVPREQYRMMQLGQTSGRAGSAAA